jgi:hypothetical protein
MARFLSAVAALAFASLVIAAPVGFSSRQLRETKNFRVVREDVLYRSAQLPASGLKRVLHDYRIRTVVTLRDSHDPGGPAPDLDEEKYCGDQEINYLRLPPLHWEDPLNPGGPAPVEPNVRQFLAVMRDRRNYPVLIHCYAGVHRTGAFAAMYRMEFEHWSHADALAEMRTCGYVELDNHLDILGYLEHFRPSWAAATRRARDQSPE